MYINAMQIIHNLQLYVKYYLCATPKKTCGLPETDPWGVWLFHLIGQGELKVGWSHSNTSQGEWSQSSLTAHVFQGHLRDVVRAKDPAVSALLLTCAHSPGFIILEVTGYRSTHSEAKGWLAPLAQFTLVMLSGFWSSHPGKHSQKGAPQLYETLVTDLCFYTSFSGGVSSELGASIPQSTFFFFWLVNQ